VPGEELPEPVIEPELPIVDAHHHLWLFPPAMLKAMDEQTSISARALLPTLHRRARYLFDEYMQDLGSGHNIRASVFVESDTMYRASGSAALRSVGEVEFVNGVAAMGASGNFGEARVCAGIVGGGVDLAAGSVARESLEAHIRAGNGRYKGLRASAAYDSDPQLLGPGAARPHLLTDERFRRGFRHLHELGLSFDVFVLEPQLAELTDLAHHFPQTQIILDHMGTPLGVGHYAGRRNERFPIWRRHIRALSRCANVSVKLGGIGMHFAGFEYHVAGSGMSSERLANDWRPYVETCIEAFGPSRCMFESNYPVDSASCTYRVLWNAFKRITRGASQDDKTQLYGGTAARVYRLADV
jgi:L-fuconolactonase